MGSKSGGDEEALGPMSKLKLALANVDFKSAIEVATQDMINEAFDKNVDKTERKQLSKHMQGNDFFRVFVTKY